MNDFTGPPDGSSKRVPKDGYSQERHERFVADGTKQLHDQLKNAFKIGDPSTVDLLIVETTKTVRQQVLPIVQAGGYLKDRKALRAMICKLYLEQFSRLSKDELENMLAVVLTDFLDESIKKSPLGKGSNDLLSGADTVG